MRRLRQSLKRVYRWRKATPSKDAEGNTYTAWGDPVEIDAIIRRASGKIAAAQYGERLQYICKMQYDGAEPIAEGDGICVYVSGDQDPDYRVTAVKGLTEDAFRVYELEAIL